MPNVAGGFKHSWFRPQNGTFFCWWWPHVTFIDQDHIGAITSNAVMAACAAGHAWGESVRIFWDAWPVGSRNFGLQGTVSWNFVCGLFLKFGSRNLIRGTALYLDFKIRGSPSIFRSPDPRLDHWSWPWHVTRVQFCLEDGFWWFLILFNSFAFRALEVLWTGFLVVPSS